MVVERIKYKNFNDVEIEEDFYFNFNEAEITEMQLTYPGGLKAELQRIMDAKDQAEIIKVFKRLILMAYGRKSADGKRFEKSEEISREFEQTNAYSQLFMKLAFDDEAAARWVNGVIPQTMLDEANNKTETPALAPVQ
jgi:hypothetical protein